MRTVSVTTLARFPPQSGRHPRRVVISASSERSQVWEVQKERQVLRFREPSTGVQVVLIGTMHYNPASIQLVSSTVAGLAADKTLGALVLETCPQRWKGTLAKQPPGSALRSLLDNEFQAAVDAAGGEGTLVLGDQPIDGVMGELKELAAATFQDALSPWAGWARLRTDLSRGYLREFAGLPGVPSLAPTDLLMDPRLLLCLPVSLVRYPLGMLLKSPRFALPTFGVLAGLDQLLNMVPVGSDVAGSYVATPEEIFVTILFACLDVMQVVLLARCFLIGLLEKRNDILASSVRGRA